MKIHINIFIIIVTTLCLHSRSTYADQASTPHNDAIMKTIIVRDPFWPVGFYPVPESKVKKEETVAPPPVVANIKWPKLKLTGISRASDNEYFAIIEKIGMVEEGDIISVIQDEIIYRWKIEKISSKGISSKKLSAKESTKQLQNK